MAHQISLFECKSESDVIIIMFCRSGSKYNVEYFQNLSN
jgi:hypothetical protein